MFEYLLVFVIVSIAAFFSFRKIRQSSQGSCSGCQQCPSTQQGNCKNTNLQNKPRK